MVITMEKIIKYDTSDLDPVTGTSFLRQISVDETAPLHTHEFFEMFIVTDGKALHLVNDSVQNLESGDFVLMRPDDRHCYDFCQSSDFTFINFAFSVETVFSAVSLFLPDKPMEKILSQPLPPVAHLSKYDTDFVSNELLNFENVKREISPEYARNYFRSFLPFVLAKYFLMNDEKKAEAPLWLANTVSCMQSIENFRRGFSRMLELASCSGEHLCREFRKYYGTTPVKFINGLRLGYSMYLLAGTETEIIDICEQSGFNSLSHFYHLFSDRFGMSPMKFRKSRLQ